MTAASTSSRTLGREAASTSAKEMFFGLAVMSIVVESSLLGSASVIRPALARRRRALPSLVGSLGMAIFAFLGRSARALYFFEYSARGSMWIPPALTRWKPRSVLNDSR